MNQIITPLYTFTLDQIVEAFATLKEIHRIEYGHPMADMEFSVAAIQADLLEVLRGQARIVEGIVQHDRPLVAHVPPKVEAEEAINRVFAHYDPKVPIPLWNKFFITIEDDLAVKDRGGFVAIITLKSPIPIDERGRFTYYEGIANIIPALFDMAGYLPTGDLINLHMTKHISMWRLSFLFR